VEVKGDLKVGRKPQRHDVQRHRTRRNVPAQDVGIVEVIISKEIVLTEIRDKVEVAEHR
jgi:hypothetical protein